LERVEKRFGAVTVLPPLDLTLEDGEFTVLVGPSGCGKSTTLRMIAGLESLSAGEIWFDGRAISRLEPKERDIAMVFQDYALYPHMNVARNMSFALRLARVSRAEIDARVRRVAGMLNITHLLERKPAELSGGQRQRVAMGRAMVRDASTFLFDEPLSNLDAKLRAKMRTELAEMRDTIRKSMIYVTHDQIEAMTLGDRIVVMKDGVIQQQGTPETLFRAPINQFVASFIGSPTMNFLPGRVTAEAGVAQIVGEGFALPLPPALAARVTTPDVTLGLRPSSFRDDAAGAAITMRVVVTEYLGAQSVVVARCGPADVLVETPSDRAPRPGAVASFGVNIDDIMLFDRNTGKTL
jgi:multiple sugar transport system ATP-binding protein